MYSGGIVNQGAWIRGEAALETVEEEGAGGAEDSGSRGVKEEAAVTVAEASVEDELDQEEAVVQEALVEEAVVEEAVLVDEAVIEDL